MRHRLLIPVLHLWFRLRRGMTLGVRAIVQDAQGRVFLVRHSYVPGWHLPGGGIELGQSAEEALAMELAEEGNIILTETPHLFGVYFNRQTSPRDHVLLYRVENARHTGPRAPDHEIVETGFFFARCLAGRDDGRHAPAIGGSFWPRAAFRRMVRLSHA